MVMEGEEKVVVRLSFALSSSLYSILEIAGYKQQQLCMDKSKLWKAIVATVILIFIYLRYDYFCH